jgi:hypothetical protein
MDEEGLTAFGRWVRKQPRGTMREIELKSGLAYSTVHGAQKRLVSLEVARVLCSFTHGEVKVGDIKGVAIGRPSKWRRAS